jgi:uncharacterized protein (TIGR02246 family)
MNLTTRLRSTWLPGCAAVIVLSTLSACNPKEEPVSSVVLTSFATRYAAAWSGKDPVKYGEFYEENGSLVVNGSASEGRAAVVATARAYMEAFPDMAVRLESLQHEGDATVFHWTWTGTNTGPGGTGRAVRLTGYERWTFGPNGLILRSDGHFAAAEYQRQLKGE